MFQRKDPSLKTVSDACRVLAGWKNQYGNKDKRLAKASDGVAFTTTGNEEKKAIIRRRSHVTNVENQGTTPTSAKKQKL